MRQKEDPNFAQMLGCFYTWSIIEDNVCAINNHLVHPTTSKFKHVLFTSNLLQASFNQACTKLFAWPRWCNSIPESWEDMATPNHQQALKPWLPKRQQDQSAPYLSANCVGMLVMYSKNNLRLRKVANGTLSHIIGYRLQYPTTSHHQVLSDATDYSILVSLTYLTLSLWNS